MEKNILIVAGEPSGDTRAGELLAELKEMLPGARFWGIGGDLMRSEGVELVEHISALSIVGVWEVVKNLSKINKQYNDLVSEIRKRKPSLAVLVDYPGFNLRLASFLHKEGIPVIYYVIPQVWAWGGHRVKALRKNVDKALVLFEFEKEFLERRGVDAEWPGHPIIDRMASRGNAAEGDRTPAVALLPGSRKSEVSALFPVMLEAAGKILEKKPDTRFVVAQNSNVDKELYDLPAETHPGLPLSRVVDDTRACLDRCDLAMVASGTATLETAVMGKPMIVTYKASALCYYMYKLFIRIPFLGLVNIIAGREVAPELLQNDATPEKMAEETLRIMLDPDLAGRIKKDLEEVKRSLGGRGASRRAAGYIASFMREKGI